MPGTEAEAKSEDERGTEYGSSGWTTTGNAAVVPFRTVDVDGIEYDAAAGTGTGVIADAVGVTVAGTAGTACATRIP
ncbi:hypothetical protein FACS1894214_1170 [Planctomycetales bacterium]|nr:hypothetical protein FACS1894214_1170 [Planctomycetales bacterium]